MDTIRQGRIIDVRAAGDFQAAVDSLPPEGGVLHVPSGEYTLDATVRLALAERQHLCIAGDGRTSVLRFTAEDGSPFMELDGVPNSWWPDLRITIRDLTFVGNHACGDCLRLRWPNDALIDACFFESFGGTAIVVTPNATNVTIRDCWMRDCRRALHADNLHHLTFHGNQTRSANEGGLTQREHVYIGRHCREVRIVNNHLAYGHSEALILDGTAQHVVSNNTIEGFPVGIRAVDCRDITITSNYIHCPVGLDLAGDNRGLIVTSNIMTDNSEAGFRIRDAGTSGGHVIASNIMRQNDGQSGIDLGDAEDCIVSGNLFEDLSIDPSLAVRSAHPSRHTITGNRVTDTALRAASRIGGLTEPARGECRQLAGLAEHLRNQPDSTNRLTLTFHQIAQILGGEMPVEARNNSDWWANDPESAQSAAWLGAGWLVAITKRIEGRIVFARIAASC
jgi:hypothetical protein